MKQLPIVLVHKGDSFYLKYAIQNVRMFNPDSKIFLICEGTSENFDSVEKLELSDFNKYSKVLDKIYVHRNRSNPEIELFCIKRWLVLLDFMEKKKFQKIFTMDSDVLLFENVSKDMLNYKRFDVLLANGASAGLTFINNPSVLKLYSDIVFDFYKTKIGKVEYESNGTITDMSFWKQLKKSGKFNVGEVTTIIKNTVYDAGLLIEQNNIKMKRGVKEIIFNQNLPYGKTNVGVVRMKCLHCQGPTKFYMKYFANGKVGFVDSIQINVMMWMRDNVSPILSPELRGIIKKTLTNLGF